MGLIIDRSKFEKFIAQKVIEENNFEIKTNSFVVDAKIEKDYVKVLLEMVKNIWKNTYNR